MQFNIIILYLCFQTVATNFTTLKEYNKMEMVVTNQNYIHEGIKNRLHLDNACYYSIQNLLSSHLLSRKVKIKTYKTIILPAALCGCIDLSSKGRTQRMSENNVMWRIFEPKKEEVERGWEKWHDKELHNFYSLPNITKMIKSMSMWWVEHVACMGKIRHAYKILVCKSGGKRLLRRTRHSWEDSNKIDLKKWDVRVWTYSTGSSWGPVADS
jgi:hypothetical protein